MDKRAFSEGLAQFYSSQAELILAQYENINQLLGPTKNWTPSGTHCEILIRDFLRRNLLHGMSVDKGFIYGRVSRDGKEYHGPEIDVLIHDTMDYHPVFRLDDFVIVQPEAVLGIIQIKRTFRPGKDNSLAKGIRQAVDARQHLLDVLVQAKVREKTLAYGGDDTRVKKYPEIPELLFRVFSAVVSFDDETNRLPETYGQYLLDAYVVNKRHHCEGCPEDSAIFGLPDFVGSLKHICLISIKRDVSKREYYVYNAIHDGKNVGIQMFLASLVRHIFDYKKKHPPFAFPEHYHPLSVIVVPPLNLQQLGGVSSTTG
jgi:hypothetical protein